MIGFSVVFGGEIFKDSSTGLVWQDNSDAKNNEMSYEDAIEYCSDLSLAGKSDWRLPKIQELQSIVDIKKYKPAIKDGFKNVASSYYWSSSENVSNSSDAWGVDFLNGYAYSRSKSDERYVRCVRGRQ